MANKNFDNPTEENAKLENEEWEYELCDNVDYNGIEYSCYDGTAEASIFVDDDLEDSESITIPQTIVNSENNKGGFYKFIFSSLKRREPLQLHPQTCQF